MKRPALRCVICGSVFPTFGDEPRMAAERASHAFRSHACAFNRRVQGIELAPTVIRSSRTSPNHPAGGAA